MLPARPDTNMQRMSTTSTAVPRLDQDTLARVAGLGDEGGILTVLAPFGRTGANQVRELLSHLERDGFPEPGLDDVAAPGGPRAGQAFGRVLALSTRERYEFTLTTLSEPVVEIGPNAIVVPIARAFDATRPVGIVDVHSDRARIVEVGAEWLELAHVTLDPQGIADWVELKGPAAPNPQRASRSVPQRERFERRLAANRARTVRGLGDPIGRLARRRGWRSVVLAGDPSLTHVIAPPVTAVMRVDRPFPEWQTAADLAEHVRPVLVHARELAVATLAEAALARPRGFARGAMAVRGAVGEGRARTIVAEGPLTDRRAAEAIRLALAQRLPVLFSNDQLMDHGLVCELHG
jgi:hypothetical protein